MLHKVNRYFYSFNKEYKVDRQRFRINRERLETQNSSSPFAQVKPAAEPVLPPSVTIRYRDVTIQLHDCDASTIVAIAQQLA